MRKKPSIYGSNVRKIGCTWWIFLIQKILDKDYLNKLIGMMMSIKIWDRKWKMLKQLIKLEKLLTLIKLIQKTVIFIFFQKNFF